MSNASEMARMARRIAVAELELLAGDLRTTYAESLCTEMGGSLITTGTGHAFQQTEITLLSVTGIGPSPEAAIVQWMKAARRIEQEAQAADRTQNERAAA